MKLDTGAGGRDKNAMDLKEINSNEEPLLDSGAAQNHAKLFHGTCHLA